MDEELQELPYKVTNIEYKLECQERTIEEQGQDIDDLTAALKAAIDRIDDLELRLSRVSSSVGLLNWRA